MAVSMEAESVVAPDEITEVCYLNGIPAFAETELARLYGHVHSSVPFFRTSRPADCICTYVAWQNGVPIALLVFRRRKGVVHVYNELVSIPGDEINRFARYIFQHFKSVNVISFKGVQSDIRRLSFPHQCYNSKENWEIDLPSTPEEYTARLGKATRENVKRYRKRLLRDHPSFTQGFYTRGEIDEQQVREIIELSKTRISAKRMKFGMDEAEIARIVRFAKERGFVCVMYIGGKICAGTVSYCVGSEYLAEVVAHDSRYDAYWLGTFCYYTTICESISRGARKFHMGGGRNEYKTRLGGVRRDMRRIEIYRSYGCMAHNLDRVASIAAAGCVRMIKVWLLEREKSLITQSVFRFQHALRRLRGHVA